MADLKLDGLILNYDPQHHPQNLNANKIKKFFHCQWIYYPVNISYICPLKI